MLRMSNVLTNSRAYGLKITARIFLATTNNIRIMETKVAYRPIVRLCVIQNDLKEELSTYISRLKAVECL